MEWVIGLSKISSIGLASIQPALRREPIINVLLFSLLLVNVLRLLSTIVHQQPLGFDQQEDDLLAGSAFLLIILALWNISRRGHQVIAAWGILGLLSFAAIQLTLRSSFELPMVQLVCALIIVIAGISLSAKAALAVAGLISVAIMSISYAQISGYLHPNIEWVKQDFQIEDILGYVAILCLITLVSWLANREIMSSLTQALASKAELASERDKLEVKVLERTHELEQAQKLRTLELQRFAEFGRVSASLLHEIANPLTAASLHLELYDNQKSSLIVHARSSLQQLERYLQAARLQLKTEGQPRRFSVRRELLHVAQIMIPLANRAGVKLNFEQNGSYHLYGDPVKFNQLVANLITNSLEAYEDTRSKEKKRIVLAVTGSTRWLRITVTDWGKGIRREQLTRLFEPFYTTKTPDYRGMGIGLAMVKQIIEKDFHGSIKVTSSQAHGTVFTATLKYRQSTGR